MIFIVDDHHDSADYLARLLRRAGYAARTFPSAIEVLREFVQPPHHLPPLPPLPPIPPLPPVPRLMVLDVMMPEMSGIECLRELRAREATAMLPVIMYTADVSHECRHDALAAGAQEFLVKGAVRWPAFLATVQKMIGDPSVAPAAG